VVRAFVSGILVCLACSAAGAAEPGETAPSAPVVQLAAGVAELEDAMEYFPVEPGRKWSYQIRREGAAITPDRTHEILLDGRWKERFVEGSDVVESDDPAFVQVVEMREVVQGSGLVNEGTLSVHLSVESGRVLAHAMQVTGLRQYAEEVQRWEPGQPVFQTPRSALEYPAPARLGVYGLTLIVRATSMAIETVQTAAGTFDDCLKVTTAGTMSGRLNDFPDLEEMDVTVDEVQWFARRVGLVKQHRVLRGDVAHESHGRYEINLETFKELRAYTKPRD